MENMLITIFIEIDDFCKFYNKEIIELLKKIYKKNLDMTHKMALSEIIHYVFFFIFQIKQLLKIIILIMY